MDELIKLENELIVSFPARLQKDKYTMMQFIEHKEQNAVEFTIKNMSGRLTKYIVIFDSKKYQVKYSLNSAWETETIKNIKGILKFIDKNITKL